MTQKCKGHGHIFKIKVKVILRFFEIKNQKKSNKFFEIFWDQKIRKNLKKNSNFKKSQNKFSETLNQNLMWLKNVKVKVIFSRSRSRSFWSQKYQKSQKYKKNIKNFKSQKITKKNFFWNFYKFFFGLWLESLTRVGLS